LNEELSTGRVNDSVTSIAASILNTDLKDTIANNKALSKDNKPDQQSIISVQPSSKKDTAQQVDFLIVETPMVNSNCTQNATPADLEKLERKMVSQSSDDDKIKAAKKVFKTKCFTTQSIRQLSRLFITGAGKYNFYDMSYPFVSDSGLYYTLESEILDSYYLKRFQALINK
jgi:hypothetical protein